MPFETFDLGRVLQTAQAIKGMRNHSITEKLQQQYLGSQIRANDQKTQQDAAVFDEKQQIENTRLLNSAMAEISQNVNAADRWAPLLKERGVINADFDWRSRPPEEIQAGAKQMFESTSQALRAYKGGGALPTPLSSRGKLMADQRAGFLTPEQVEAANAPKRPQSYEEHILAQKDPEFANFLRQRKGKGLSVTLPDGTVVEMGGDGSGVSPGELSKPTVNNLQETLVSSSNRLDRLNQLISSYRPEFLRAKGLLKAGTAEVKDFLGMDVSEEGKQFLRGYSEFKASASQEFSATLKELSGTAASEGEVARVIKGVPSDRDRSPEVFEAKARATTKFVTRAIMRANWALKNGIGVNSVNELSKRMPLEGIDGVYESRANQIWQELGGTPETKQQAIQQANTEFGLAR